MRILEERKEYTIFYQIEPYSTSTNNLLFDMPANFNAQVRLDDNVHHTLYFEFFELKKFPGDLEKAGKRVIRRWKKEMRENAIHKSSR